MIGGLDDKFSNEVSPVFAVGPVNLQLQGSANQYAKSTKKMSGSSAAIMDTFYTRLEGVSLGSQFMVLSFWNKFIVHWVPLVNVSGMVLDF